MYPFQRRETKNCTTRTVLVLVSMKDERNVEVKFLSHVAKERTCTSKSNFSAEEQKPFSTSTWQIIGVHFDMSTFARKTRTHSRRNLTVKHTDR